MTKIRPGSQYVFAADLVDEGAEAVVRRNESLGLTALSLAMAYHQSRDVVPHTGEKPRVRYRRDGVNFRPSDDIWGGSRVRPTVQSDTDLQAVAKLLELTPRIEVEAWLVILHNSDVGERYPDLNGRTCFGDRLIAHLCPAQPDVQEYAVNLVREVARLGMDVIAEALNYQPFPHGHHHERTFTPVNPGIEFLLSLCFCEACIRAGVERGINMESLRARVCSVVDEGFDGREIDLTIDALSTVVGNELRRLLRLRNSIVTELATRVSEAVHAEGRRFSYMDLMGSVMSYDHGSPVGPAAADDAWRLGIDIPSVAAISDSVTMLAYSSSAERVSLDVASYVAASGGKPVRAIVRPGYPDTRSAGHLREKVAAAAEAGADQVDFYNYGMYTQKVLDRVALAFE